MVDVTTQWTETVAVPNKAQRWVFEALQRKLPAFPFPILGLDSDNGSEFINHHLFSFCTAQRITFTRSRLNHKNDNCHVEQKNWAVVRKTVGYLRCDTPEQLRTMNALMIDSGYTRTSSSRCRSSSARSGTAPRSIGSTIWR